MTDKLDPNKFELVLSRNRSLEITKSNLVKRGLELIDKVKEREVGPTVEILNEMTFEIINEIEKKPAALLTNHEKEAIEWIIGDSELHHLMGSDMFFSTAKFYEFLYTEVKFHAKEKKVAFEKAKEAYIFWAKKYHSAEYDQLS